MSYVEINLKLILVSAMWQLFVSFSIEGQNKVEVSVNVLVVDVEMHFDALLTVDII